jgi:hypothetical protein
MLNQLPNEHEPIQALTFLVAFAQIDLEHASEPEQRLIERNVQMVIHRDDPGHWKQLSSRVDVAFLREAQRRLCGMLKGIAKGGPLAIAGDLVLSLYVIRDGHRSRMQVLGSDLHRLLYQVARLLEAVDLGKIRACPANNCGRMFVKVTKKEYCSTRCQSRTFMQQYRANGYQPLGKRKRRVPHDKTTRTR